MLVFTEEQLAAAMDRAVDRCIHINSQEKRGFAIRHAAMHEGIALATAAFQALLAEARGCVSYQAGMQNLNTDAGQKHAANLEALLCRIDAALEEGTEQAHQSV